MRLRHWLPVVLALSTVSLAGTAHADTPPDVVRMKDGGMLRGTIVEMSPTGNVVITLPTGEQRSIPMSEVQYAGPAAASAQPRPAPAEPEAPTQPPPTGPAARKEYGNTQPLVTVHGQEARLQLRGTGITFHRKTGTAAISGGGSQRISADAYEAMCTAPCEVTMPRGSYQLALSNHDVPVDAKPVNISGDSTLEATYTSRAGTRTVGWILIPVSLLGGTALILATSDPDSESMTPLMLGFGVIVGGSLIGWMLAETSDEVDIRVIPGAPSALHPRGDLRADRGGNWLGVEPGLTLAAAF